MTDFKITITGDPPKKFAENLADTAKRYAQALAKTMQMAADFLEAAIRNKIASSGNGNWGSRWTDGFHANLTGADNMIIGFSHDIEFATIFDKGGEITGDPLLWLPVPGNQDSIADYGGKLFSIKGASRPLLVGEDREPKYFGIASVMEKPLWDLDAVIAEKLPHLQEVFNANLQEELGQ